MMFQIMFSSGNLMEVALNHFNAVWFPLAVHCTNHFAIFTYILEAHGLSPELALEKPGHFLVLN